MAKPHSAPRETRLDALYATPPPGFVALRNALAHELAREHDPRSEEVRKLPRPTVPVWAINLVARAEPDRIQELLAKADEVVRAHRLALGGTERDVLREANQALATALDRAASSAIRLAGAAGHPISNSMVGRVRATLRALAFGNPEARGRLRGGRVLAESSDTGLDALEALSPLLAEPRARARERESPPPRQRETKERGRALALARREAAAAAKLFARAAGVAARVRQEAEDAQRRAEEMKERTRDAERELEVAARQRDEARRRLAGLGVGSERRHPL